MGGSVLNNNTKGSIAIILSAVAFSIMGMIVKYTGEASLFQQVFFRNVVMAVFGAYLVKKNNHSFFGSKENRHLLFLRSIFGFLGVVTSYYATRILYLGDAQALLKISPFVVTVFAAILLKEKIDKTIVITLVVAFIGALIIVNPKFDSRLVPSLAAITSAVLGGIAYVIIGVISKKENPEGKSTIIFLFAFWSLVFSAPFIGNIFLLETKTLILLMVGGGFASLAQYLVTTGYAIADASRISIFDYVSLIVSPILGKIIFNENLPMNSYIGIFLILLAGYISYLNGRKKELNIRQ